MPVVVVVDEARRVWSGHELAERAVAMSKVNSATSVTSGIAR